ncbi:MAG: TIGR04211 family SH3 domain-containing protein [Gammaproteobacteria bacterium]|nr:TIGR04211 family SH3 domain-containing protein [Gammaproteobacteria bacterium]
MRHSTSAPGWARLLAHSWCLSVMLVVHTVSAQTGYVIDELLAGVHREATTDSPIIKVLTSGTVLEVLSKGEAFSNIRTEDGATGWIETKYLTEEKPAKRRVAELEQERDTLNKALDTVRSELMAVRTDSDTPAPPTSVVAANTVTKDTYDALLEERDALLKEVRNYSEQVAALKQAATSAAPAAASNDEELATLNATVSSLRDQLQSAKQGIPPSDLLRQMEALAEENKRLRDERQVLAAPTSDDAAQSPPSNATPVLALARASVARSAPIDTLRNLDIWQLALLGFSFLLAFSVGGYWIDYLMRRRHGGFRL